MDKTLEFLIDEYTDRINMIQKAIAVGNCANFEEYKYACGQIRGLESACLTVRDLKKRMENSNE